MKQFIKFIDTIKANGVIGANPYAGRGIRFDSQNVGKEIWERIESTEPFVFMTTPSLDDVGKVPQQEIYGETVYENIDAPFPNFSIECLDGPLGYVEALDDKNNIIKVATWCIQVSEYAPKTYRFLTLISNPLTDDYQVCASNNEGPIVEKYLDLINTQKTGIENVRVNVRIGSGKEKRQHRIRRIIHVRPKAQTAPSEVGRPIDWSHRFEVRGHWVSLPGRLGKDREGNYCVKDWTWRTNYVKGPEHLPLIKKTRLVEE